MYLKNNTLRRMARNVLQFITATSTWRTGEITMKLARSIGKYLGLLVLACAPLAAAVATPVTITYYTISSTDPDVNHLGSGTFNNEVQDSLGSHGLPVLNTSIYGCTSNCFAGTLPGDVTSSGEITWWSPALNTHVTETGTETVSLPFSHPSNFFPPNGTGSSDQDGYQAAVLSATLHAGSTEQISFNIGADDAAFAYLDGSIVCSLGGVHASTAGTCITGDTIAAGDHDLLVFFADLNRTQSGLTFGITTQDVTTTPTTPTTPNTPTSVPEPAALGLFGLGLLFMGGLVGLRRRHRSEA